MKKYTRKQITEAIKYWQNRLILENKYSHDIELQVAKNLGNMIQGSLIIDHANNDHMKLITRSLKINKTIFINNEYISSKNGLFVIDGDILQ